MRTWLQRVFTVGGGIGEGTVRPASLDSRTNVRYHDAMDAPHGLLTRPRRFSLFEGSRSPLLGHALAPRSFHGRAMLGPCGLPVPQAMSVLSGMAPAAVCGAGLASTPVDASKNKKVQWEQLMVPGSAHPPAGYTTAVLGDCPHLQTLS